jgi:hypothetical protein
VLGKTGRDAVRNIASAAERTNLISVRKREISDEISATEFFKSEKLSVLGNVNE